MELECEQRIQRLELEHLEINKPIERGVANRLWPKMAEYFLNKELERMDFRYNQSKYKANGLVWTTSDGKRLIISDMSDTHLLNCIHLCERREGCKGEDFLNNAPTYIAMVFELIGRKKLKYAYLDLLVQDRLLVKF